MQIFFLLDLCPSNLSSGKVETLIVFCARTFWKNSRFTFRKGKPSSLCSVLCFRWILMFSWNERRNWWVTYISGGKSRPTLVHKFTNHARLSLKFTFHVSVLASFTPASRVNPFTRMQTRRNWSINRCSTGETFLIALSKSALQLLKFEPRWYTWGLKKKNEKKNVALRNLWKGRQPQIL